MRLLTAALALILSSPAMAQETMSPALLDDVEATEQMFGLGLGDKGMVEGTYFERLSEDLEGSWVRVSQFLVEGPDDPERLGGMTARACKDDPTSIRVRSPLTIVMTSGRPPGPQYDITYVYQGFTGFSAQVEAGPFLERMGVAAGETPSANNILALGNLGADVSMHRPYPDVLVITRVRGSLEIYARCETAAATPVPEPADDGRPTDEELAAALGNVFDEQFNHPDPALRETLIACAAELFSALSTDDLRLSMETNFNPPVEERERMEAANPGLGEGAIACAEAAAGDPASPLP